MTDHFTLEVDPHSLKTVQKWLSELGQHLSTKGGTVTGTPEEIGNDWTGDAATSVKSEMTTLGEEMKGDYATDLERLAHEVGVLEKAYRHAVDDELPALNRRWREAQADYDQSVKQAETSYDTVTDFDPGERPPNRAIIEEARRIQSSATGAAHTDLETAQGKIEDDYDELVEDLKRKTRHLNTALVDHTPVSVPKDAVKDFRDNGTYPEHLGRAYKIPGLPMSVRKALETVTTNAPSPDDPKFAEWFSNLSPGEQQVYRMTLSWSTDFKDFDPRSAITPGSMPFWAQLCSPHPSSGENPFAQVPTGQSPGEVGDRDWGSPIRVMVDGKLVEYGYVGGGSIKGPGGAEWPIMQPYMEEDGVIYMDETGGGSRDDGGLMQLDGNDPGWSSVTSYRGVNQYMDVDPAIGIAGAIAGLDANRVYPGAVYVTPDGSGSLQAPPPADVEFPGTEGATPSTERMNPAGAERWNRMSRGIGVGMAGLQAYNTIDSVASHEQRPWFVEYQINEDGRRRAIVRTYQAGTTETGDPVVGSFANTFNSEDKSTEYAYAKRLNGPIMTDPDTFDTTLVGTSSERVVDLEVDLSGD